MAERYQLVIIGSGPAGLSAGARASARGLNYVLLERQDRFADTIQKYQRGKFVMATPDVLPLHGESGVSFEAGSREQVLGTWESEITTGGVKIRYGAEVAGLKGQRGGFQITLRDGGALAAEQVVLAIGVQGNLRKLDVPGAELGFVQYQLDDPEEYAGETIVVIGAGDAAIENAIALAAQNQVVIVNRRGEFARAKTGNLTAIEKAIDSGRLECVYNAAPVKIEPGAIHLRTPEGTRGWRCDRVIARLGADPPRRFLEACGITFAGKEALYPEVSVTYETNVAGLYAVGALAGYPLIKHCINQGYEVAETIAGYSVVPADEPLMEEKLLGMPGRPAVIDALQEIKAKVPLFEGLTTLQLREFLLDSELRVYLPGEVIFERNGFGNTLFCTISGTVEFDLADTRQQPGTPLRRATCGEGDFFGEAGLVAGRRRAGTARAQTDCVLLELARRSAIKLLNSVPSARALFERTTVVRQLQRDLSSALTASDLERVLASAEIKQFSAGTKLIEEGATQDRSVYLIRSGSVTVSRRLNGKDVVLAYLPVGHIVGEMALLRQAPRRATVSAAIATEAIRIDGAMFEQLLDERPDLRAKLELVVLDKIAGEARRERNQTFGGVTDFLVAQGVGEATDVLLIDESLCIRCDNCEKACAESHDGISRLDREAGPTFAMVHVPTSCRHCEHPHCMEDCPPDAIHRGETGEVWIDDTCIGCGNCVVNCPYGVIQMASPPPPKPGLLQWLLLGRGPGPGGAYGAAKAKDKAKDPSAPQKVKVAVKCDMCKGIDGGPACVRGCPTGAAIRVNPAQFLAAIARPQ